MNENNKILLILSINSIISFVLSFLIIFIPSQVVVLIVAGLFEIPTKFEYFKLIFPIPDHSYLWTQLSVSVIYAVTPLIGLIVALFSRWYFNRYGIKKSVPLRLLLIWLYIHGMNFIFGALIIGIPLIKDVGFIPDWLYFPDIIDVLIISFSFIVLIYNGVFINYSIQTLAFDESFNHRPYYSLLFKWYLLFMPFLVSILFFNIFNFPNNTPFIRLLLSAIIIQFITVFPYRTVYFKVDENIKNIDISWKYLFLLVMVFILFVIWRYLHNNIWYA